MVGEELFVAFPARAFPTQGVALLVVFAPASTWTDWRIESALPTRPLEPGEMCCSIAA